MTEHMCNNHPRKPGWRPGKAEDCSYHGKKVKTQGGWRVDNPQ